MAKLDLNFAGINDYIDTLIKLGEDAEQAAENTLLQAEEIVNEELHKEMKRHHVTGKTERSIRDSEKVKKNKGNLSIRFGFDIKKGGEPAIYLEKGRPHQRPTPVKKPALDRAEKRFKEVEQQEFEKAIGKAR